MNEEASTGGEVRRSDTRHECLPRGSQRQLAGRKDGEPSVDVQSMICLWHTRFNVISTQWGVSLSSAKSLPHPAPPLLSLFLSSKHPSLTSPYDNDGQLYTKPTRLSDSPLHTGLTSPSHRSPGLAQCLWFSNVSSSVTRSAGQIHPESSLPASPLWYIL